MSLLCLFLHESVLEQGEISSSLRRFGDEVELFDPKEGKFQLDEQRIPDFLRALEGDNLPFSGRSAFLIAPRHDGFAEKLLHEALDYYPGQLKYLSDLILKEMSFGDYSCLPFISAFFRDLPEDLVISGVKYLECGMDGLLAAKALYIHRNTFNYRLAQFIRISGVDIREYHNALLFEIYLQYIRKE